MSLACRRRMIFMMSRGVGVGVGGGGSCFLVFLLGKVKGSGAAAAAATATGDDRDTNCNDAKGLYFFSFFGSMVILNEGVCLVVDTFTCC